MTEATVDEMQPQDFGLSTREGILFLNRGVELARHTAGIPHPAPRTTRPESEANREDRNGERR